MKTMRRFLKPFDIAGRERTVFLEFPGIAESEVAKDLGRNIGFERGSNDRSKATLGGHEVDRRRCYIKEGKILELPEQGQISMEVIGESRETRLAGIDIRKGDHRRSGGGRRR